MKVTLGQFVGGIFPASLQSKKFPRLGKKKKRNQDRHKKQTPRDKECRNPSKLEGHHTPDSWAKCEGCEFGTFNQAVRLPDTIAHGHVTGVGKCACCIRSVTYPEHRQRGANAYREPQE